MRKHYFAKILTLVLTCTLVFAGATVVATETGELIDNPGFETLNAEGTEAASWSYTATSLQKSGGYGNGGVCLLSAGSGNLAQQAVQGLTPETMVRISFYYKAAEASNIKVNLSFRNAKFASINKELNIIPYFDSAETWTQYKQDVYLPANAAGISMTVSASVSGVYLDAFSLTAIKEGNLIVDGDFEDGTDSNKVWYYDTSGGNAESINLETDDAGSFIKIEKVNGNGGVRQSIPSYGNSFMLSFRFKNTKSKSAIIQIGNGSTSGLYIKIPASDSWEKYTVYFTLKETGNRNFWLKAANDFSVYYYDDIVLRPISDMDVRFLNAEPTVVATAGTCTNVIYAKGTELTSVQAGDIYAVVRNKADAVGSMDAIVGVYGETGEKKQLQNVEVGTVTVSDVSAPGYAIMKLENVAAGSTIETFFWNSISGMQSVCDPISFK